MERNNNISEIWIEVSNIALNEGEGGDKSAATIDIQFKGDNEYDRWLIFNGSVDKFKPLMEAMKDKRPVHARLTPITNPEGGEDKPAFVLKVTELRISFSAPPARG